MMEKLINRFAKSFRRLLCVLVTIKFREKFSDTHFIYSFFFFVFLSLSCALTNKLITIDTVDDNMMHSEEHYFKRDEFTEKFNLHLPPPLSFIL